MNPPNPSAEVPASRPAPVRRRPSRRRPARWVAVFALLGLAMAGLYYALAPIPYRSTAKFLIRYVPHPGDVMSDPVNASIRFIDPGDQALIRAEQEILTSLDVVQNVARMVGEVILSGENAVRSVEAPQAELLLENFEVSQAGDSPVLQLTFHHPNAKVPQPVLKEWIKEYLKTHTQIHYSLRTSDEILVQHADQLRAQLVQDEENRQKLLAEAGIFSVESAAASLQARQAAVDSALLEAQLAMAQCEARLDRSPDDLQTQQTRLELETRQTALRSQFAQLRVEAAQLQKLGARVIELQEQIERAKGQFQHDRTKLEQARMTEAIGPNRVSSVATIQEPSLPRPDPTGVYRVMLGMVLGSLLLGLAMAYSLPPWRSADSSGSEPGPVAPPYRRPRYRHPRPRGREGGAREGGRP